MASRPLPQPVVSTSSSREISAIACLEEANVKAWGTLGVIARSMGNEQEAAQCFFRAKGQTPGNNVFTRMGAYHKAQNNYQKAIEMYRLAVESNVQDGEAWADLAYCFLMINDLPSAFTSYQQAYCHSENIQDGHLWYGIGLMYSMYGSFMHAMDAFNHCLRVDPNFELEHDIRFRVAMITKEQGKIEDALKMLHDLLPTVDDPKWCCDIWSQIGRINEMMNQSPAAKNAYLKALEYDQNHVRALQQLGRLYYKEQDEAAIEYMKRATEIDPKDGLSWYLLGRCYMAAHSYEPAYVAYKQAVAVDPDNPNIWCSLGVLYYKLQQNRDALDAYTRAIVLDPNLCEVWYNVGTLYDSSDQFSDALDAYKKAVELGAAGDFIYNRINVLMRRLSKDGGQPQPVPEHKVRNSGGDSKSGTPPSDSGGQSN